MTISEAFKSYFWRNKSVQNNEMNVSVVPLHEHPEYLMACVELLNDEWKRSETARLHSLTASCDTLPTCLVLLQDKSVIGHAKLSKIPRAQTACFIESVVIAKHLRRKGFGTILMEKAEDFCRGALNLETIYLSTHDQVPFYSKLGYVECPPVSIYGGGLPNFVSNSYSAPLSKEEFVKSPAPPPLPISAQNEVKRTKVFMKKEL